MTNKKVFISQPMNGKSDEDIDAEREKAISRIKSELGDNIEILDSFIDEECPTDFNAGLWYLGKSLMILAEADVAYFINGWENARGCMFEHECAIKYGIGHIIEESPIISDEHIPVVGCTKCPYVGHFELKECPDAYTDVSEKCGLYNHDPMR